VFKEGFDLLIDKLKGKDMITNEYKIRKWDKQLNTHPENKED